MSNPKELFEEKCKTYTGQGGFHIGCYECDNGMDEDRVWQWHKEEVERILGEIKEKLALEPIHGFYGSDSYESGYNQCIIETESLLNQKIKKLREEYE